MKRQLKFYIKKHTNPQLGVYYYDACGQLTRTTIFASPKRRSIAGSKGKSTDKLIY